MPWAFDNSVCQTRTVTNFYYAAAYILAKYLDNPVLMEDLLHITDNCNEFLFQVEEISRKIADKPWSHVVVVADAELEGIADEASLAFKEICQLPSNYYHILDSRHGPMVLFNKETLILAALGPKDKLEIGYLNDMSEKESLIVAFTDVLVDIPNVIEVAYGRKLSHIALGLPFIMLCQLISYYKAAHTGADPDRPSGLSAWISLDDE
jgi:fructoselysine-6-P-deglycase FrlB-like protein